MLQTQSDHELAQIFLGNDLNKLQEILSLRHKHRAELLLAGEMRRCFVIQALLYADPFDVEAQKKIEEAIRQALDTEEDEVYDCFGKKMKCHKSHFVSHSSFFKTGKPVLVWVSVAKLMTMADTWKDSIFL
nr:DNA damage-inducible protein 1 [Ipomoea batatas]